MMQTFLRSVPLFAALTDADLARICQSISEISLDPGEVLFEEGAVGDRAYVVRSGELEIYKQSGKREILLAHRGPGEIIGEIALFENATRTASVRARQETTLVAITREQFDQLIKTSHQAAETLFYTVLSRLRAIESSLRQSEKMAQLGTLSAGMAHELNNPAAAVQRGSNQLGALLDQFQELQTQLTKLALDPGQLEALAALQKQLRQHASQPPEMDTLYRADLQDALENTLKDMGILEPWRIAPELVDLGMEGDGLAQWLTSFGSEQITLILQWLIADSSIQRLLYEIKQGAERISNLVSAMKSYAYLDQAPSQEVDIHKGLDDTLVILGSKIKSKPGLSIRKQYDPDLPSIYGFGSELNQVWTNLLDNALDAIEAGGQIIIRTSTEDDHVVVEVEDDGQGIPAEIQERVFEAFFTTKPPGQGTGLGLDISYNIVAFKHQGDLSFTSEPGRTCFR
ncbi:MAG: cyclic nucleotide-binding domain-containing protein, partial [Anaerolineales bacterium]|nr:cyclic nucleotide-binding domain-containing protein [Anaerolineales bacterium]